MNVSVPGRSQSRATKDVIYAVTPVTANQAARLTGRICAAVAQSPSQPSGNEEETPSITIVREGQVDMVLQIWIPLEKDGTSS